MLDREGQMDNPCTQWLNESSWDNITELDKYVIMTVIEIACLVEQFE